METERLCLRPFHPDDAPRVQELAGDREVAHTTLNISHPYEDGLAEQWIGGLAEAESGGKAVTRAVVLKDAGTLIGAMALRLEPRNRLGELGYWIGRPYWNRGYCTEAARVFLAYGFGELGLNRIQARHMTRNPASGRVMQKIGMVHEGTLRQAACRDGIPEDLAIYAILRTEANP